MGLWTARYVDSGCLPYDYVETVISHYFTDCAEAKSVQRGVDDPPLQQKGLMILRCSRRG